MATDIIQAQPVVARFGAVKADLPGAGLAWLTAMRAAGLAQFTKAGLPTPRLEAWKYTDLRVLEKTPFGGAAETVAAPNVDLIPSLLPAAASPRLVFVDGRFCATVSDLGALPDGVTAEPLAAMLERAPGLLEDHLGSMASTESHPMVALNTALMADGLVLRVAPGVVLEAPLTVTFLGGLAEGAIAYHPRNLIILEDNSRATVIEHHAGVGPGIYLANGATDVRVGPGAALCHVKVQAEGAGAFHLATMRAHVDKDAGLESFSLATGARLSRNEIAVRLAGAGARCRLNGAYMMRGAQHCDNTTVVDHLVPDTACDEVFKGVLDDTARAVFQGRITVHPDAQRTDGNQTCKTLLLSDGAEIDAKPELEIYADDVKCSHGATVGELDAEALFYLRSRGLPEATARNLLIESFLAEALADVAAEDLRSALLAGVTHWLSKD
jgi:Fe-S cluster assembly protein SufD